VGVFAVGLGMMFGASFRLRGAELVTVFTVGGILAAFAFIKMVYDSIVSKVKRDQVSDTLRRQNAELAVETSRLKRELNDERSKRVKVSNIQPILEMVILEAECEVTKVFDRYFDKDNEEIIEDLEAGREKEGSTPRKRTKRFLGALTAKFKAKYGVDLRKVQVKPAEEAKTIYVAGAAPSFSGLGKPYPQMRWEGSVGLHLWLGSWSIDDNSLKLESTCREKYRIAMEESLQNGPEQLEWVKEPLKKNVKLLLKMMIAPPDYNVELVENADKGFTPLFEYMGAKLGLQGPDQLLLP